MENFNPLALILSSHRRWDTETFMCFLWDQVLRSEDPMLTLKSFPVTTLGFKKTKHTPSEHEFLLFQVPENDKVMNFILERTVSMESNDIEDATIDAFLGHADSKKMMKAIVRDIGSIPPSTAAVAVAVAASALAANPSVIPALLVTPVIPLVLSSRSSSPCLPLMDEGPSSSHLPRTSSATILPEYSLVDQASMAMAELLQVFTDSRVGYYVLKSSNKSKPDGQAQDEFVGGDKLSSNEYKLGVHLGEFRPKNLNLFHLALLAHVVHVQNPLYALFKSQCYWFASTVFYAAQIIDRDLSATTHLAGISLDNSDASSKENDMIFLPFHLYMPKEAGRWKGIRISGCKQVVLSTVVKRFHEQLDEIMIKVHSYFFGIIAVY